MRFPKGRVPDGAERFEFLPYPSPSVTNNSADEVEIPVLDFTWSTQWRYEASGNDLGTEWKEPDYDDAEWEVGARTA